MVLKIILLLTLMLSPNLAQTPCWSRDIKTLRVAVASEPGNLGLKLRLARALLRPDEASAHPDEARSRLQEARKLFAAILAVQPDARDPLRAKVIDDYATRHYELAVQAGRRLLRDVKVDAGVSLSVLRSLIRLKRKKEAASFFADWIARGAVRSFGEAQGMVALMVGDRDLARLLQAGLEREIKENPQNVGLYLYKAVVLAQLGHNVDSWRAFHQAERLGLCGLSTGYRHGFASELLDRSMEPDEGPWSYDRAQLSVLKEKLAQAPGHGGLAMRVARVLDTEGQRDSSLAYYREAARASPGLWPSFYRQAQILDEDKKFSQALPLFRQVLKVNPAFEVARLRLGLDLARVHKMEEARQQLLLFARRFLPVGISRELQKEMLGGDKNLLKLRKLLQDAVRAAPRNPYLRGHLALALHLSGSTKAARAQAQEMERLGIAGALGGPHPILLEVFDRLPLPAKGKPQKDS